MRIWNHVSHANAPAFTKQEIEEMLAHTFEIFRRESGTIEFYVKDVTHIAFSQYWDISSDIERINMFNDYYDNNALNIHLVNNAPSGGFARIPGNKLYISNSWNLTILAHELGHNFGLEHTHKGRIGCSDDNADCSNCRQEPVSRSMQQAAICGNLLYKKKCEVNGDNICDTAGEPNLNGDVVGCEFNPDESPDLQDNWGAFWQPNFENIMSYSQANCRTEFSWGQVGVMLDELQKSRFNFKTTTPQLTIAGPASPCPNQTYTYSIPQQALGVDYLWQVPDDFGWSFTGQDTREITVTTGPNPYGDYTIYVNLIDGGPVAPKELELNQMSLSINGPSEIPGDLHCRGYSTTHYPNVTYTWITSTPNWYTSVCTNGSSTASIRATAFASADFTLTVTATDVCGTQISGTKQISIGNNGAPPISIGDDPELPIFSPNPVKDMLYFTGSDNQQLEYVQVYSLLSGKEVATVVPQGAHIDLSTVPRGIYVLHYTIEGKTFTTKIAKQ